MITCIFILTSCSNDLIHDKYIQQASRKGKEAKYGYHVPEQPEDVLSTVRDRLLIIDWGGGVEGFWLCKINDITRY